MSTRGTVDSSSRTSRVLWVLVLLAVLAAVVLTVLRGAYRDGALEPSSPQPDGARAVVQVLEDLGVGVERTGTTQSAAQTLREGGTVLVTFPDMLNDAQLELLARSGDAGTGHLVLVKPSDHVLEVLDVGLASAAGRSADPDAAAVRQCPGGGSGAQHVDIENLSQDASDAPSDGGSSDGGSANLNSVLYAPRTGSNGTGISVCPQVGDGTGEGSVGLVAVHGRTTVLGSPAILANGGIDRADNASIALAALGPSPRLAWYLPSPADPMATETPGLMDVLPRWLLPSLAWLAPLTLAALAAAAWRLGPVILEPMPVQVRAQELTIGRARLMEASRTREAAAASLRAASLQRLAAKLGMRRERTLAAVIAAAAQHTSRTPEQLRGLLATDPVATDEALVRLAHSLDALEKEIDR